MYKKKREHRQRKRKIPTSAPHVNGPRHVPMADTPSSIRVKISSVNVSYQLSNLTSRQRRLWTRRSRKKERKQRDNLIPIYKNVNKAKNANEVMGDKFTYWEASPNCPVTLNEPNLNDAKPGKICYVQDLQIIDTHLRNANKGLIYKHPASSSPDIVLVPHVATRKSKMHMGGMKLLFQPLILLITILR